MKRRFAIATELLSDDARGWSNLGDWSHTNDYATACRALAERVGEAAQLGSDTRVLDLGCGAGASLALWREHFGAQDCDGIEAQPAQAARARVATAGRVHAGLAQDVLRGLGRYDAIVSVDAAYHFGPLAQLLSTVADHLEPGGQLAFTTLTLARRGVACLARPALAAASIAPAALFDRESLDALLAVAGFSDIAVTTLDREVLAGFAAFVARRRVDLTLRARLSPGWLKIAVTAHACRALVANGRVHYVLVRATRR